MPNVKAYLEAEVEHKRDQLINAMKSLGEDLVDRANRLKKNPEYCINSLGEVQGRGTQVDAFCGAFAALKNALRDIEEMKG